MSESNQNINTEDVMRSQLELFSYTPDSVKEKHFNVDNQRQNLISVEGEIPSKFPDGSCLNIIRKNGNSIHSIGFQPAKFIDELPRWAINRYSMPDDIVLDPFCGSGTTLVEAVRCGRKAQGVDYHPLSCLISTVKANPQDPRKLQEINNSLFEKIYINGFEERKETTFDGINFWFDQPVIAALEILKKAIFDIEEEDCRNFFKVVFSATVRKMSNMNDGMILAARRPNHSNKKAHTKRDVYNLFFDYAKKYLVYLSSFVSELKQKGFYRKYFGEIIGDDARSFKFQQKVDFIVASPPYINSVDYVWASKLELHWLDMVESAAERLCLYLKEIGTERIPRSEFKTIGKTGFKEIDKIIEEIYFGKYYKASGDQNFLRARTTYKYFIDMKEHFVKAKEVLKPGGYYCLVVGDNRITKVRVPTARFLAMIAEKVGFRKQFQFQIILKNRRLNIPRNVGWADTIKHDYVIVLQNIK